MGIFNSLRIGYILTPGFREADVIQSEAVFQFQPRNTLYFIADKKGAVHGDANFGVVANTTFNECPDLDILVVGKMTEAEINKPDLWQFIAKKAKKAKCVIGGSNGVWALYKAGVIKNEKVTADRETLELLKDSGLQLVNKRRHVEDKKIITAGPSTGIIEASYTALGKFRGDWISKFAEYTLEYDDGRAQYPLNKDVILEQPPLPRPMKIGFFAADGLYTLDIMGAIEVFSAIPNAEIYYIAPEKGISKALLGMGPSVVADTSIKECPDLDVLMFGASHPKYVKDKKVMDFINRQEKCSIAMTSVCAGTFLLGSTGLLEGRDAATNIQMVNQLPSIGVSRSGKKIVIDGKFFSSGPAVGSYEAALITVEKIAGRNWAQYIEHEVLEFAPNAVYGINERNISPFLKTMTKFLSLGLKAAYAPSIKKSYYGQGIKTKATSSTPTVTLAE